MKSISIVKKLMFVSFLTSCIITDNSLGQNLNKADIYNQLPSFFETKTYNSGEKLFVYETLDSLPKDNIFSGLLNDNMLYLDYLIIGYANIDYKNLDQYNTKPQERKEHYIQSLIGDTLFNEYFLELLSFYLDSKGIKINDYSPKPKLKITTEELTECASKFFYALKFVDSMNFSCKICVGINGHKEAKKPIGKLALVEAFCAMTVLNNLDNPDYNYKTSLSDNTVKVAEMTKNISDAGKRIEAARPLMYEAMSKSPALKALLLSEYQKKKSMLNFEIVE